MKVMSHSGIPALRREGAIEKGLSRILLSKATRG